MAGGPRNANQFAMDFPPPKTGDNLLSLSDLPSDWNIASRISLDVETKDPDLRTMGIGVRRPDCYMVGTSISFEDGPSFYLPTKHAGGGNLDHAQVMRYLKDCAAKFTGIMVNANTSYDLDYLEQEGVTFPQVKAIRDVLVVEALLDELQKEINLDSVSLKHVGVGKDEEGLRRAVASCFPGRRNVNIKKLIWALHAKHVEPYAIRDSQLPLKVLRAQERIMEELELNKVYEVESAVTPVLLKMRRRGIKVNSDKLDKIAIWARKKEAQTLEHIRHMTGVRINVGDLMKPDVVAPALINIGFTPGENAKGGYSIDKDFLNGIDHPVAGLIRWGRQMSQIQTTFISSIRKHMIVSPSGECRIHGTLNQLRAEKEGGDSDAKNDLAGAITGRLSGSYPNLQNQLGDNDPKLGPLWRAIYEAEDKLIAAKDYSQQEPKLLVHWSVAAGVRRIGEEGYNSALKYAEMYKTNPSLDFYEVGAREAKIKRKQAKIVVLARIYGRGGASTCRELKLPTAWIEREFRGELKRWEGAGPEGQALINILDRSMPFASKMLKADTEQAKTCGFIRTILGRRLHFEKNSWGEYDKLHKALNKRIQGSAADQTKVALVELDRAGYYVQLQIHDEIVSSVASEQEARGAVEIMENCLPLFVPSKVDLGLGRSWGETM